MMQRIYSELTNLNKSLCLIKNSISYRVLNNKSTEKYDKNLDIFLELIKYNINLIDEAPKSLPLTNESVEFLTNLAQQINELSKGDYDVELGLILANKDRISNLLQDFSTKLKQQTNNQIDTTANEFTLFLNNLQNFRVLANTHEFSDTFKVEIAKIQNELTKTKKEYEDVNKIYDDIKRKNEKFNYFIDAGNNEALKELYENIYIDEKKIANEFRNYAIIILLIIGSIILLIIVCGLIQNFFSFTNPGSFNPIHYSFSHFIRFIGLFSLTVPAWYLAKESNKHRQVAYKAKILGTGLTAFPHYVKELSDEDHIKMRTTLADKFFGQELYSDKKATNTEIQEQSKLTLEALKTAATLLPKKPD
ncbi:MAG: hypothetical protein GAK29_04242 [Acinetobacter bereziniae]|uniref:Uncharacterized protein n=1 Tax=Acinetobacter bereziniae TaxID=106648 RepID=A0A833PAH0_ACIBZ|nr:MAG: hypothetical protein GAK29_04242 [Acinetobacter bereziniae]